MGEYRRDVKRYLKGEMETYPWLPVDHFDAETERSLREIESKARGAGRERLLGEVSAVLAGARIQNTWRAAGSLIYRNWLEHLNARKRLGCPLGEAGELSIRR
jgi:homoserine O-succinyltransferase